MKLEGIRVLDMTAFLPGPYATQMLADHGADVIKIEAPGGEPTRRFGPVVDGFTPYFRNTQRGKRSIRLDLKHPEGRAVFFALAASADVVVESYRPGVVDRLGVGYAAVRAVAPDIVYCSLSAFGQEGPYAQRPSHDLGAEALTGVLSVTMADGAPPSFPPLPIADVALGLCAVSGIAMALYRREQTGEGDLVDVAMLDALMSWTPHLLGNVVAHDRPPDLQYERLYGAAALYHPYRTADGRYLVLSGLEFAFAEHLLGALERPDLVEVCRREPWGPAQARVTEFLRATFATRTLAEWEAWLADKDVAFAPVLDLQQAWHSPLLRERGMVRRGADGIDHLGTPLRFAREPGVPSSQVPALGEHADEILASLGYDDARRAQLHADGVC